MKKALFFLLLALSINVFSQNKRLEYSTQHTTLNSIKNIEDRRAHAGLKTSGNYFKINTKQTSKHHAPAPLPLIQLFDSVYVWELDEFSSGWRNDQKLIDPVYDTKNNLTNYMGQIWNGAFWVNEYKVVLTYNVNNNETSYTQQDWDGTGWGNSYKTISTYDANNNETNYVRQDRNGSVWENNFQIIYSYVNNNRTSSLMQTWDGSVWENSGQNNYAYDANNNLTEDIQQGWTGNAWENANRTSCSYDANNHLISLINQSWESSAWENSSQSTFTYVNNNMISYLGQIWSSSGWVNSFRGSCTYDANNNLISQIIHSWDNGAWVNSFQLGYTYDSDNFTLSETYKGWNIDGTAIEEGDSTYYYFHTVEVGRNDLAMHPWEVILYPNPASGYLVIEGVCAGNSEIQLKIYDVAGRELRREIFSAYESFSKKLNISALPAGEYQVSLADEGNKRKQIKFVKY